MCVRACVQLLCATTDLLAFSVLFKRLSYCVFLPQQEHFSLKVKIIAHHLFGSKQQTEPVEYITTFCVIKSKFINKHLFRQNVSLII